MSKCSICKHWDGECCCNPKSPDYGYKSINQMYIASNCFERKDEEKVDHPSHYQGQHECIDIMRAMFGDEAVKGFCRCNAYKYRFRSGKKDGNTAEQDIAKAEWYENYLIEMEGKTDVD